MEVPPGQVVRQGLPGSLVFVVHLDRGQHAVEFVIHGLDAGELAVPRRGEVRGQAVHLLQSRTLRRLPLLARQAGYPAAERLVDGTCTNAPPSWICVAPPGPECIAPGDFRVTITRPDSEWRWNTTGPYPSRCVRFSSES